MDVLDSQKIKPKSKTQTPIKKEIVMSHSNSETLNGKSQAASDVTKKAGAISREAMAAVNQLTAEVKKGAIEAEKKAKEYMDGLTKFARRNPVYVTVGAFSLGLTMGILLCRRRH